MSVVGAVWSERQDAEEGVQDAFVRLLGKWGSVSAYDDPEAWLRKVALGLASNRRRKARDDLQPVHRLGVLVITQELLAAAAEHAEGLIAFRADRGRGRRSRRLTTSRSRRGPAPAGRVGTAWRGGVATSRRHLPREDGPDRSPSRCATPYGGVSPNAAPDRRRSRDGSSSRQPRGSDLTAGPQPWTLAVAG